MVNNMNKFFFVCVLLAVSPAFAGENVYRPYVGLDYVYDTMNAKYVDSYLNSGTFVVGSEYNKYFGTEVFYQRSLTKGQEVDGQKMKSSLQGYGLDVYGYLPLGCAQIFAPYVTAGLGKYSLKKKIAGLRRNDKDGTGYRIGAGISYRLDNNISFKAGYRYVDFHKLSTVDNAQELVIGVRYAF